MERIMNKMFLTALMLLALPFAANAGGKAIYGGDDRKEYFEVSKERQAQADAVVSLWDLSKVSRERSGAFFLSASPLANKIFDREGGTLCASEPFREQPRGAECSGTLVGEDLVMTAGHCINTQQACDEMMIVFDFNVKVRGGTAPSTVPASSVYSCKSIVASRNDSGTRGGTSRDAAPRGGKLDYAIIRLDRKVTGRKPLPINRKGGLADGSPLFTIGHPTGLPAKIAGGASVLNIREGEPSFEANLDTYAGNSGSGVFNAETGLLEGILVRGRDDFKKTPEGCYASEVFKLKPQDGGEAVTRISLVAGFIPELENKRDTPLRPVPVDVRGIKMEIPSDMTLEGLTGR